MRTRAKGLGMRNPSQERNRQEDDDTAATGTMGAPVTWAAATTPGFTTPAGPRGPSGVTAISPPRRKISSILRKAPAPPRVDDLEPRHIPMPAPHRPGSHRHRVHSPTMMWHPLCDTRPTVGGGCAITQRRTAGHDDATRRGAHNHEPALARSDPAETPTLARSPHPRRYASTPHHFCGQVRDTPRGTRRAQPLSDQGERIALPGSLPAVGVEEDENVARQLLCGRGSL